ncbi:lamina-associated polypeptide 2, isoforms beta/delta/epsilon/gamma-like isoform X1 [Procambarus clarkii]|uniref:lamina-associated polypeptide 2, isoforms beta/delta/epsilon/gamma-like isoform X1 n=1 Tax=Procambarus clarkii TaxID=6728 RepID=UPI003743C6B3
MSELTKEQLKSELITHGVPLPSPNAKKHEYKRLYEKYVAPVEYSKGDFSSDDEDLPINDLKYESSLETSLMIDGFDITKLDDDELFSRLKDLGAVVGPIVDSTRSVYQKKLFVMMGGYVPDAPAFNGEVDEDEYSGSEEEVVVEKPVAKRTSFVQESTKITTTSASPSDHTDIRKRLLVSPSSEGNQSSVLYDPDRHTPSPRRSIRTVTSSSESYSVRKFVNNGRSGYLTEGFATRTAGDSTKRSTGTSDSSSKKSMLLRFLLKLFIVILIIAVALYFYQINDSESPFKAVEQLARQALEAAVGEEATVEKDVPHTEPATEPSVPQRDASATLE